MKIRDSVAFVTGANRGLGRAIAIELLARGAKKVYAGVRDVKAPLPAGVIPVRLDVTSGEEVARAAELAPDVTLVVNNAGIARVKGFLEADSIATTREIFETNFYGPVRVSQAFAPILKKNGGGAIVNVLSVASWVTNTALAPYAASKSAAWAFTNALRHHLREQGTQVVGLHVGFIDTDMTKGFELEKVTPEHVARETLDGVEAGAEEVLADERTKAVRMGLGAERPAYLAAPII